MPQSAQDQEFSQSAPPVHAEFPGEHQNFVAALPQVVRTASEFDLHHLWRRAQDNARGAKALDEELATTFQRLCEKLKD